jgi:hypothetical protein
MKHLKLFESYLKENNEITRMNSELEKAYGKKVMSSNFSAQDDSVMAQVEFADGLEGNFEGENQFDIDGTLTQGGRNIPFGKGTPQQEKVREMLVDWCQAHAPEGH